MRESAAGVRISEGEASYPGMISERGPAVECLHLRPDIYQYSLFYRFVRLFVSLLQRKQEMVEEEEPIVCVPGQRLCLSDKVNVPGPGTYEQHGYIYAKLAGTIELVKDENTRTVVVHGMTEQSIVPAPGDIVTAMVTLVNQRFCKCTMKCIGDVVLTRSYRGILRKEDVRATEKDRVELYKSFRPGDIILARVMPMTEAHTYQLSTAENELGVVVAHSEDGVSLVPISWTEMQCPKTLVKEHRKVAKVVPEEIAAEQ